MDVGRRKYPCVDHGRTRYCGRVDEPPPGSVRIGDQVFSKDGRRRRRETNQHRVIAATLSLLREGSSAPTVGDVAERAQVSERSVFRYFADVDALLCAAVEAEVGEALAAADEPATPESLDKRVELFVSSRASLFQRLEGALRAIRARVAQTPQIAEPWAAVHDHLGRQRSTLLHADLVRLGPDHAVFADLVESLASIDSYFELVRRRGHEGAVTTMQAGLGKLLAPA